MIEITSYDIENNNGDSVSIANYGARIVKWNTRIGDETRSIVLGYDKLEDYLHDPFYLGAIVGPYANRIAKAECLIDNKKIKFEENEGVNQLHGGPNALADQFWQCTQHTKKSVTLSCKLTDGFNGYPGEMIFEVKYEISSNSELIIALNVNVDKVTIIGPTAHPYFNLNGKQGGNKHSLQIASNFYTPVNAAGIPLGEIKSVQNTDFDFKRSKSIPSLKGQQTLDNNFLISLSDTSDSKEVFHHASLLSDDKKIKLITKSNYPAIQVYTGQHLQAPFTPLQGICLEPQFCPDSPNQTTFPFHLTKPEKPLKAVIIYQLEKVIL